MTPSRPPSEETKLKLKKLNNRMNEHKLVEKSSVENNGHDVDILVKENNLDLVKKEIQEKYDELAILEVPYIASNEYRITVGYAGRL